MALRSRHGTAKGTGTGPVIEVLPPDEQQPGLAAPPAAPSSPVSRRENGTLSSSEAARELGRRGGLARAERRAMAARFASSLRIAPDMPGFEVSVHAAPFVAEAEQWLQAKIAEIAANVGGGEVGAGVVSMLRTAAFETYASRMLFELGLGKAFLFKSEGEGSSRRVVSVNTHLLEKAARFGDAARQNLLAAHELARLEALARAGSEDDDAPWATKGGSTP